MPSTIRSTRASAGATMETLPIEVELGLYLATRSMPSWISLSPCVSQGWSPKQ
jgi:hypothetical protein